jgi:hypothetical protein
MTGKRRFVAAVASLAWFVAVGLAWLVFAGGRIAPCFGGVGPGADAARERCAADYLAAHPVPPLVDSPLFWLAALGVGLVVIWRVARA